MTVDLKLRASGLHKPKSTDIALVVIDTFQMARGGNGDVSYAGDYEDMRRFKELADGLGIALLLVHHLRKRGDSDELNKLSGTTGISGAADAVFVLDKSERMRDEAKLICTGRDIESRELQLRFNREDCLWELEDDSLGQSALLLPDELAALVELVKSSGGFSGSNSELACEVGIRTGQQVSAKGLKQMMNKWRGRLEREGVSFRDRRSNGSRIVELSFSSALDSDASDVKSAWGGGVSICVPFDPDVDGGRENVEEEVCVADARD